MTTPRRLRRPQAKRFKSFGNWDERRFNTAAYRYFDDSDLRLRDVLLAMAAILAIVVFMGLVTR